MPDCNDGGEFSWIDKLEREIAISDDSGCCTSTLSPSAERKGVLWNVAGMGPNGTGEVVMTE